MQINRNKLPFVKVFVALILIVSVVALLYLLFFPRIAFTGKSISLQNMGSHQMNVDVIIKDSSYMLLRVTNHDEAPHYLEKIGISGCDEFNKVIAIDSQETTIVKVTCPDTSAKELTISYKKQGDSTVFEYTSDIKL